MAGVFALLTWGCAPDGHAGKKSGSPRSAPPPSPKQGPPSPAPSAPIATTQFVAPPELAEHNLTTQELFRAYCGACHSLELATAQRLDRSNWEWVMDDMIEEYGGAWITGDERDRLVEYLVEQHGPKE